MNETTEELAPYIIEGARSSRSRCKTCRRKIDKGALRIGVLIEGPYGTGYMWHHLKCAARRQFDKVEEAYAAEAWNEAKEPPAKVPGLDELRTLREKAEERKKQRKEIPHIEPAPSGRARCKQCEELIEKGSIRVVLGRGVSFGSQVRVAPINVHPKCVAAELLNEDCVTEAHELIDGIRANSGNISPEALDATIAEIGDVR